jgi:hypothetical protein
LPEFERRVAIAFIPADLRNGFEDAVEEIGTATDGEFS